MFYTKKFKQLVMAYCAKEPDALDVLKRSIKERYKDKAFYMRLVTFDTIYKEKEFSDEEKITRILMESIIGLYFLDSLYHKKESTISMTLDRLTSESCLFIVRGMLYDEHFASVSNEDKLRTMAEHCFATLEQMKKN